jgi:hypothetical protein
MVMASLIKQPGLCKAVNTKKLNDIRQQLNFIPAIHQRFYLKLLDNTNENSNVSESSESSDLDTDETTNERQPAVKLSSSIVSALHCFIALNPSSSLQVLYFVALFLCILIYLDLILDLVCIMHVCHRTMYE